jgi:DNA polymerase
MKPMDAEKLKLLGLWPVWRLRGEAASEADAEIDIDTDAAAEDIAPETDTPELAVANPPAPVAEVAALGWDELADAVRDCTRCGLHRGRKQGVPGVGDRQADWLIVGEAPGAEEDRLGEPFVGQAGKLLDAMLAAIQLKRGENVYIANVLKSRPPNNRDPQPDEVAACLPYLERQVALIQPRIILALGRVAAQSLLGSETAISRLRGGVHRYQGVPLVVTYHPAYLLRNPADKAKVWEDLCLARRTLLADAAAG